MAPRLRTIRTYQLPDDFDAVFRENGIAGDHVEFLLAGLGDQHPIERIPMRSRQLPGKQGMLEANGENSFPLIQLVLRQRIEEGAGQSPFPPGGTRHSNFGKNRLENDERLPIFCYDYLFARDSSIQESRKVGLCFVDIDDGHPRHLLRMESNMTRVISQAFSLQRDQPPAGALRAADEAVTHPSLLTNIHILDNILSCFIVIIDINQW